MPDAVEGRLPGQQRLEGAGQGGGGEAGPDGAAVGLHGAALGQEPLDQAGAVVELQADDGGAQREDVRRRDLAQELGAAVEVDRVGLVGLPVAALAAAEDAVGGEVDQAGAGVRRRGGPGGGGGAS